MNQNQSYIEEHLLLSYLLGRLEGEELSLVEQWLNESETNRRELDRLESLWLESGKLTPPPLAVDVDRAWVKMSNLLMTADEAPRNSISPTKTVFMTPLRWISGVAAVILLALGTWWGYMNFIRQPQMLTFTGSGVIKTDTLPDGSLITLNSGSSLVYPETFSKSTREVKLKGEAFFKVKPDKRHAFIVNAGEAFVKVVGTSFRVKAGPDGKLSVEVREGIVLLFRIDRNSGDTASILLPAGSSGRLVKGSLKPEKFEDLSPDGAYWLDHTLKFRDSPLSQVLELISKYSGITVRAVNPAILDCHLTATFENEPADMMLRVICESFNLKLSREGNTYVLSGDGCSR